MFVRIARFEGGTAAAIEAERDEALADIATTREGGQPRMVPAELAAVARRVMMLANRESGSSALLMFFDSEDDMRTADGILQGMSPSSADMGRRISADGYEVILDETM